MGEYDRNTIFDVVQVELENGEGFFVEPGYKLCKGGKRVSIINPKVGGMPLDIILHDQEAYVKQCAFTFTEGLNCSGSDIVNMSSSIHHSLAII